MKSVTASLSLALLLTIAGCGIKPRPARPGLNVGQVVTQEDIQKTGARTMWDALSRTIRYTRFQESGVGTPERIRRRGPSSLVLTDDMPIYIDEVKLTDIQVLASLPARDIERIQVINGIEATTYYGTNAGDGVILIRTLEANR